VWYWNSFISFGRVLNAKTKLASYTNVKFAVQEATDILLDTKIDMIIMPDSLEHRNIYQQNCIIKCLLILQKCLKRMVLYIIHIPNPNFLDWIRTYNPNKVSKGEYIKMDKLLIGFFVYVALYCVVVVADSDVVIWLQVK
jgi:hypothetical protein